MSSFNLTRWRYGLHILSYGVVPPSVPMLHQTLLSSATFNTCPPIFTPSAICYTLYKRYITNEDFSTDIVPYYLFCQLLHLVPRHRHWETFLELGLNNKIRLPFDAVFNHHLLGEDRGTWTLDFKIKSFVLCQLSYILIKYRGFMRNYKYPPALVSLLTTMQESFIVRQTYGASGGIRTLNPIGKGF